MNAPIRYFGGKGQMRNKLYGYFPAQDSYLTFVDAFGGSGTVLLGQERAGRVEIYNDLEENVYSLYKVLSDKVLSDKELFGRFKKMADLCYYSEQIRKECKEMLKTELDIIHRAFCFWYVNRTSISGIGGFSVNLIPRCGISKSTSDFLANLENLESIHKRLQTVIIRNMDVFELLEEYDKENCFLYLDPPYHQSTRTSTRYKIDFMDEQHRLLVDKCLISKSKIMISGYDNKEYDRLVVAGWKKVDMEIKTTSGNGEKKTKIESIWINYEQ